MPQKPPLPAFPQDPPILSLQDALQSALGDAFRVTRELSGGGMSRVFVAYEAALKREIVVKVLPPDLRSASSLARFRREIEVTAQLQHPHILPVIATGGDDRLLYYVVPYVASGSLRSRLLDGKALSFDDATRIATELLAAVAFAHDRGIVHRDIKPGNVLLSEGHAVLADFGIARAIEALIDADPGSSSSIGAPEAYRAPERPAGGAVDLYAIAVLGYEMLTGQLPRSGTSDSAIAGVLLEAHRAAPADVVRAVARVFARALSVDPVRRFASAQEFREALLDTRRPVVRSVRRRRLATGGLLAAAVAITWAVSGDAPREATPAAAVATLSDGPPGVPLSRPAAPPRAIEAPATIVELPRAERRQPAAQPRVLNAALQGALDRAWVATTTANEEAIRAGLRALDDTGLTPRERLLARGIVALGRGEYPAACAAFDSAVAMRGDHDAWMGSAECRSRDTLVTFDAATPRFRSSYYQAARAYVEAGRHAAPEGPAFAYERLGTVAYSEPARVRRGWTSDGRMYLGRAVAQGDTFTFEAFVPGQTPISPQSVAGNTAAVTIARRLTRPTLLAWTRRDPGNARARIRLIELLEASGNIREAGSDGATAYDEVVAARKLPLEGHDALRLAHTHVRILLRSRDFAYAAALADSLLAAHEDPRGPEAELLVSLAFLTGKAKYGAQLLERLSGAPSRQIRGPDGRPLELAPAIVRERADFVSAASLGICNDGVRVAPARLAAMLDALFPGGQRPRVVEAAFLERPLALALPCVGAEGARVVREPTNPLAAALLAPTPDVRAQWMVRLQAVNATRAAAGTTFETTESTFMEALVHLADGDSASALASVRQVLRALPGLAAGFLNNEVQAATLTRSMALAAQLAATREPDDARRWAAAVVALWANADPELASMVQRMQALIERPIGDDGQD